MRTKCVLPFIHYDYRKNTPCCWLRDYKHNKDEQKLLEDHKNNKKSEFCRICWDAENIGIESKRQQYNKVYEKYLDQPERKIKIATVPTGNICNLSCVTCGPSSSTAWFKKYNSIYNQAPNILVNKDIHHDDIKNIKELDHIEFIGGETLKTVSFWNLLTKMDTDTSFSVQTNGTVKLTQEQIDLLKKFSKFNICFSIDGHDKIFEYLRQPANWNNVKTNIKEYRKLFGNNKLSSHFTVSNLNIFYIDKIMLEIFKLLPSTIGINLVQTPTEFKYNNLPLEIGKIVEERNRHFFKKRVVKWEGTKQSLIELNNNLKKQDEFSGLTFETHLPELNSLISNIIHK